MLQSNTTAPLGGRYPIPSGQRQTGPKYPRTISVSMTDAEFERLYAFAETTGISMSNICRAALPAHIAPQQAPSAPVLAAGGQGAAPAPAASPAPQQAPSAPHKPWLAHKVRS